MKAYARAGAALRLLLEDVFDEQTDFDRRSDAAQYQERVEAALARLEQSTRASTSEVTLLATLHGLTIASEELALTKGLTIAQPGALRGVPDGAGSPALPRPPPSLRLDRMSSPRRRIICWSCSRADDGDVDDAIARGREVLKDLLRALRLFGDGRVTLGALAWARVGAGSWNPVALGAGGRPHGMLVVSAEQEDELRAFCNLVSRRAPHGNELAWALRRFELGCERANAYEALSDHLLALRALLEPEGPASGLLAGRIAALCATPEDRAKLTKRMIKAQALERAAIAGTAERARRRAEPRAGRRRPSAGAPARRDLRPSRPEPRGARGRAAGDARAGRGRGGVDAATSASEPDAGTRSTSSRRARCRSETPSGKEISRDPGQAREVLDLLVQVRHDHRVGLVELSAQAGDRVAVAAREHVEVRQVVRRAPRERLAQLGRQQRLDLLGGVPVEAVQVDAVDDRRRRRPSPPRQLLGEEHGLAGGLVLG